MIKFRKIQSQDRVLNMMQDWLLTVINPLLGNEIIGGQILTKIALVSGSNNVNHGLGRPLLGWYLVRQRASATVYDTQDANTTPQSTLLLTSSGSITVDIAVF